MKHRILSLTFALFAVNNIQAQILPPSFTIVTDSECINQIESEYNPDSIEIFKVVDNNYSKIKFFVDLEPGKGWEHHCVYYSFSRFKNNSNLSYSKTFATKPNSGESYIPKSTINMADTLIAEISVASLIPEQTNSVGNLYAVILSGGGTPISNYVRYWNDCSFIYKTLRNRFRVPDSNISLLISDGSDPGLDMRLGDGTLVSSPLDLDGDNTNETILAATKNNLTATLNTLAGTMTSEDRLFFFVIDHGGRYNEHSYINLWNYETIYDQELATLLDSFDVSSMNIVMGQCYSGGFISYLTAPNRIIATACDYDQYSYATEDLRYDEFVHHWTNAVNEHDIYGHEIASDTNNNGYVSTLEAFIYAGAHDIQPESPRFSAFVPSLADSLALNFSPFVYDLYIRDNDEDLGFEPNMTTNDSWISPDVWMRNQPDGGCEHEAIQVTGTDQLLNTYVRITNRGEKDYNGDGMYLHLYWAAAATGLTIDHWEGRVNSIYHISGSPLGVRYLNDTIKAGETKTILVRWLIPQ